MSDLRELERAATPGPWFANNSTEDWRDISRVPFSCEWESDQAWTVSPHEDAEGWNTDTGMSGYGIKEENAKLIAALRNAAPDLLAFVDAWDELDSDHQQHFMEAYKKTMKARAKLKEHGV